MRCHRPWITFARGWALPLLMLASFAWPSGAQAKDPPQRAGIGSKGR